MREAILNNLNNPRQLELLYRDNKSNFTREFNTVFPDIHENVTARIWHERLNYGAEEISWGTKKELLVVLIISFIAGLIARIPDITGLDEEFFYTRNISFIVIPMLIAYFSWKHAISSMRIAVAVAAVAISVVYINMLPLADKSDTLLLACMHLPIFMWTILGFAFTGEKLNDYNKRLDYLRYMGDLVVMTTILCIAGGLLSAITLALFSLLGLQIEEFYFRNIAIWGLAAAPIFGTFLVQTNPQLVHKVSPVVAKVFTPLVFIMLAAYLIAMIYTGKDPYTDRDFLMIFNLLLIGVMAIILFSIAETSKNKNDRISNYMLLGLSILTIIVNCIALSAILFRIAEWGITPNRLAVMGGNVLILTNLLIVTYRLFRAVKQESETEKVAISITTFLPVYSLWTLIVTFGFPLAFNFK